MFRIALGLVIGYVLGSKAGRERYEQIVRLGSKIADNPAVQGAAGFGGARRSVHRGLPEVLAGRLAADCPD